MENNDLWAKITNVLFRKVETPPSDVFVSRVMARINELDQNQALEKDWFRWLVPSFGFGFAVLFFLITFSSARVDLMAESDIVTDVVLADALEDLP